MKFISSHNQSIPCSFENWQRRRNIEQKWLYIFFIEDSKNLFLVIFIYLVCKVLSYVLLFDKPISIFCNHKRVLRVISIYLMGIISRAAALVLVFIHLISSNIGEMKSSHTFTIAFIVYSQLCLSVNVENRFWEWKCYVLNVMFSHRIIVFHWINSDKFIMFFHTLRNTLGGTFISSFSD